MCACIWLLIFSPSLKCHIVVVQNLIQLVTSRLISLKLMLHLSWKMCSKRIGERQPGQPMGTESQEKPHLGCPALVFLVSVNQYIMVILNYVNCWSQIWGWGNLYPTLTGEEQSEKLPDNKDDTWTRKSHFSAMEQVLMFMTSKCWLSLSLKP